MMIFKVVLYWQTTFFNMKRITYNLALALFCNAKYAHIVNRFYEHFKAIRLLNFKILFLREERKVKEIRSHFNFRISITKTLHDGSHCRKQCSMHS